MLKKVIKNKYIILFCLFCFIYFVWGLFFTYDNYLMTDEEFDLFLDFDTGYRYNFFLQKNLESYYSDRHGLLAIEIFPTLSIIKSIVSSARAAVLLHQSIIGAATVCWVYFIFSRFKMNKLTSVLLSCIYGLSFSSLTAAMIPEVYIYSALFITSLLAYLVFLLTNNSKLETKDCLVIAAIVTLASGINLINFVNLLVIILGFLCIIYRFNLKDIFINIVKILGFVLVIHSVLAVLQSICYNIKYSLVNCITPITPGRLNDLFGHSVTGENLIYMINGALVSPFYAMKIVNVKLWQELQYALSYNQPIWLYIPFFGLLLGDLSYFISHYKQSRYSNITLLLILFVLINCFYALYFFNRVCFIFAQNYLSYFVVALGLCIINAKNKFINYILSIFLIFQTIINFYTILAVQNKVSYSFPFYYQQLPLWIMCSLIVTLIIYNILYFINSKFKLKFKDVFSKITLSYVSYMFVYAMFIIMFKGRI